MHAVDGEILVTLVVGYIDKAIRTEYNHHSPPTTISELHLSACNHVSHLLATQITCLLPPNLKKCLFYEVECSIRISKKSDSRKSGRIDR